MIVGTWGTAVSMTAILVWYFNKATACGTSYTPGGEGWLNVVFWEISYHDNAQPTRCNAVGRKYNRAYPYADAGE